MYDTILVPVDGSDLSQRALEHAYGLASAVDATVHVLTVVEPPANRLAFDVDEVADVNQAIAELADTIGASGRDADVPIRTDVRRGRPVYETITAFADEIDADLIVLGRRGTSTLSDRLLGSTADRVVRVADVPVMLVPHAPPA